MAAAECEGECRLSCCKPPLALVLALVLDFNEFGGGGAKRLETILDGAIANDHGEMSCGVDGLTLRHQGTALSDEVRSEVGTEQ